MQDGQEREDQGDGKNNLDGVMRGDAEGAIVVDLAVRMGVSDLENPRQQQQGHADNPHHNNEGMPGPTP